MDKLTEQKRKPIYFPFGEKNYRIFEIDFIRGFLIILVMLDHIMFDFYYFGSMWIGSQQFLNSLFLPLLNAGAFYLDNPVRIAIRFSCIMFFFFISGTSSTLSKNNLKRGLYMLGFGLLITLGSNILSSLLNANVNIDFNVIHAVALSTLIYHFIKNKSRALKIIAAVLAIALAIFAETSTFTPTTKLLIPFGFLPHGYHYADYLALVPGLAFYIFGALFGERVYAQKKSILKDKKRNASTRPVLFIGRHSLWFYLGQQAVAFGAFTLIGIIFNFF